MDGTLLVSHAAARGQGLAQTAGDVLKESREAREALLLTEQMKDATLAHIARAASLADLRSIGQAIEGLGLPRKELA